MESRAAQAAPDSQLRTHRVSPLLPPLRSLYMCATGRYCIFLDLVHDRYYSISRQEIERLRDLICIDDIGDLEARQHSGSFTADDVSRATELITRGAAPLLRSLPPLRTVGEQPEAASPAVVAPELRRGCCSPRSAKCKAAAALLKAHGLLAARSLGSIVSAVRSRQIHASRSAGCLDQARMVGLSNSFARARPFFPRNYLCTFDSLSLALFLTSHDLCPTWIFGVREDPFYAHCWIQAGPVILNDHSDRIATFTPIMTI